MSKIGYVLVLVSMVLLIQYKEVEGLDPRQKEVLLNILEELPALGSVRGRNWSISSIDTACDNPKLLGIVSCDAEGWVTRMQFQNVFLGKMPSSMSGMARLQSFVGTNCFDGPLQASWDNITTLEELELTNNEFMYGDIPREWSALTNMKKFRLSGLKNASINIPDWIGSDWLSLQELLFVDNGIGTSNNFPSNIASLASLTSLTVVAAGITTPITQTLADHRSLVNLDFRRNAIAGPLPADWSLATSLRKLVISDNPTLDGPLPLQYPSSLTVFNAKGCDLTGHIPQSLLDQQLTEINLSQNRLDGTVPWPQAPLTSPLAQYTVSANAALGGSLPAMFWTHRDLVLFDGHGTSIGGDLPVLIPTACALSELYLSEAQMTGPLPEHLDRCSSLVALSLSSNSLQGTIPPTITNLTSLSYLLLDHNQFEGTLSGNWSRMSSLAYFVLSHNRLSSTIPSSLLELSRTASLVYFALQNNELDLCGNPSIFNSSIPITLQCNVTSQNPKECGCPNVWTSCLVQEMEAICQAPSLGPVDQQPSDPSPAPEQFLELAFSQKIAFLVITVLLFLF